MTTANGQVLSGDAIYAMPPDVSLLDLVGHGADGLRTAAGWAVRSPSAVVASAVTAAAIRAPSIRTRCAFWTTCVTAKETWGRPVLADTRYRIPAFSLRVPVAVLGP